MDAIDENTDLGKFREQVLTQNFDLHDVIDRDSLLIDDHRTIIIGDFTLHKYHHCLDMV